MKAANVAQMRAIEERTITEYGIPGLVLMENAGGAVAVAAVAAGGDSFTVVCGRGNNGGDGFVAARRLFAMGKSVGVVLVADEEALSGYALVNYDILKKLGVRIDKWSDGGVMLGADVVIDALLGIGAKGAPRGDVGEAVRLINASGKTVVSVDVPSGVNADTGAADGDCVRADVTVTFGLNKIGLVCCPGAEYAGRVSVCDISFAPQAIEAQDISVNIVNKINLPKRSRSTHKGSFGRVFALCGSQGFAGAAALSSQAALRTGCGLVTLGIPFSLSDVMAAKLTEVITLPLAEREGRLSSECIPIIDRTVAQSDAVVCGCGLGKSGDVTEVVSHLVRTSDIPVVLDADGINALVGHKDILRHTAAETVVTPHLGEMARLLGTTVREVQNDVVGVAKAFAAEYNVVTVLKSASTVVALPDGAAYINTAGNSGMATAGSGDVLSGVIASLIAQGLPPAEAAVSGVLIHARAGDFACAKLGEHGMLAGDILSSVPDVMRGEEISDGGKPVQNLV